MKVEMDALKELYMGVSTIATWKEDSWLLFDVNNAFLHGDLHEEVYMDVPYGDSTSTGEQVKSRGWQKGGDVASLSANGGGSRLRAAPGVVEEGTVMEEDPLDAGLEISMSSDNMEEDLQSNHPSTVIESLAANRPSSSDCSTEFLSLLTKSFENRDDLVTIIHKIGSQHGYAMILSSLRQKNPNLLAVSKTVYNKTAKYRREILGGRSVIQALLDELGNAGFIHNLKCDDSGHLTHLFFAHPTSIELTKNFSNVFVMDCTYKTNKYKMPLLEIVGVSSFNTSFYSCFVFMQKEETQDYIWALEMFNKLMGDGNHPLAIVTDRELALMKAIQIVFPMTPNLLCIWHIEKNILANCRGMFKDDADWDAFMSSWIALIRSWDVSTFNEAWNHFKIEYKDYASVVSYIDNTWLPWKEMFVFAWTGQIMHFGNGVTSRVEGAHGTLKKYLQVSTGGLREVKENICLVIQNQFQEIKTQLESEKIRVSEKLVIPFFK
ncbi:protein FAR-RED ELONGATED HYPOCOTYL 3-like [Argentina anserina]|uniref:protein FAR-RED ELONGATED HYPOCOTYL 3-like n=1 Tax=Argentina anserina TaxID=57926 RepID=UPI0021764A55|nr:protein FAR-RED ELONGATED HYPOCOTYL 3-like [Potentilla anserina]